MRRLVVIGAVMLVAGCSSTAVHAARPPVGHTGPVAGYTSPTIGSDLQPVELPVPTTSADVTVCQQVEDYPQPTTTAQMQAYDAYLQARIPTAGLTESLSADMETLATDIAADLNGIGSSPAQIQADANKVIADCDVYGVTS